MHARGGFLNGLLMLAIGLVGCSPGMIVGGPGPASNPGGGPTPTPVGAGEAEVFFDGSEADLLNPERGLFTIGDLVSGYNFAGERAQGSTVSYVLVRLDEWRTTALPASLLERLDDGFGLARAAGVKVLLRFAYNFESGGADASRATILGHLAQLTPVLHENADVIAAVQAGLIGEWGEWHHSSNGLDNPADRKAIVDAVLAAVPSSRAVMVRTPMLKNENWPGPVADGDAFSGRAEGRIGHHNDCFLASDTDLGTYAAPVDDWKRYVALDGNFVPVGGETCKVAPPRSDCAVAVQELRDLHWSLMSRGGSSDVWDRWRNDGCAEEIGRLLGYRFRLVRAVHTEAVAPGGVLDLEIQVQNDGFASPYNPRPVHVVLDGGGRRLTAVLGADPRRWAPGAETTVAARLRLPADLVPGDYRIGLWLPDAEESLRARPEYAIQFANEGLWDASAATSFLASVTVDPSTPGPVDATATTFVAIP